LYGFRVTLWKRARIFILSKLEFSPDPKVVGKAIFKMKPGPLDSKRHAGRPVARLFQIPDTLDVRVSIEC
jgi:hypothetical protein